MKKDGPAADPRSDIERNKATSHPSAMPINTGLAEGGIRVEKHGTAV